MQVDLLDRLINASHQVIMNGPSYRPDKRPKNPVDKNGAASWSVAQPIRRSGPDRSQGQAPMHSARQRLPARSCPTDHVTIA